MEWAKIIVSALSPLIAAAVVVVGWYKVNQFAAERDQKNKRRDLCLTMMLDVYRALASSAYRPFVGDAAIEVEKALESIQLLGTPKQIVLAQQLVNHFAEHHGTDWTALLEELRTSLRDALSLETVTGGLLHLRAGTDSEGGAHSLPTGRPNRGAGG
jgi:hypothetical protein